MSERDVQYGFPDIICNVSLRVDDVSEGNLGN